MKMKSVAVVFSAALVLAGCGTNRGPGAPVSDVNGGVTTSGVGMGGGFGGTAGSTLKAPANQNYYFDFNQDQVRQAYYPSITSQSRYLSTHANAKVRLDGNCDNRGSREYNVALGWRRAKAVKSVMLQNGAAPSQITTFSWGAEKATGYNESTWARDRRVDLTYKSY